MRKRSFGVSRSLFNLIHHLRNSNARQKTLDGKNDETENFDFLGIFSQPNLQEIGELHQSEVPIMGWYVVLDFDPEGSMI